VALGRRPNVEGLGLENAGVDYDRKGGVTVEDRLRTSQKHIFAAGDVTGQHLFTHAAAYEAGVVVANVVFHLPRKVDYALLPWCAYVEPELASAGLNEKAALAMDVEHTLRTESFASNDRALAEGEAEGRIKLVLDEHEKPLGVQILGPSAGELIAEWVAVLDGKVRLSTLAGLVRPYPTLAEINKRVAGNLLGEKLFSDAVKKTLSFVFNYKGAACALPSGEDA